MNLIDFRESEKFLLSLNVGEGYNDIVVTKKTKKRRDYDQESKMLAP